MSTITYKNQDKLTNFTKRGMGLGRGWDHWGWVGSGVGCGWGRDHDTDHLEFMISFRTTEVSSDVGGIHADSCCVASNSSGK